MARTFSHQRQRQHHKQPPMKAFHRTAPPDRHQRGPFADLAEQVHQQYRQAIGKTGDRSPVDQQHSKK